ncbi:hypothetical protein SLA2020_506070 [Shorea laevis]
MPFSFNGVQQGFKLTKRSPFTSSLSWKPVSRNRHAAAAQFMSNQQSLGFKFAQLGRDASAAGAARRLNSRYKHVEVESVGVEGKNPDPKTEKRYFRLELVEHKLENTDDDLDYKALEDGYVTITPISLPSTKDQSKIQTLVSKWIDTALSRDQ